jgi:hypothetical protein
MEKNSLKLVLFSFVAIATISSCNNSTEKKAEKVEEAKENVTNATNELNEARLDSATQYAKYKAEMEEKLLENDREIAAIKIQIKAEKQETRTNSEKELDKLIQQNNNLRNTIKAHAAGSYSTWETFKMGFNKDIDDLGKSISALAHKK